MCVGGRGKAGGRIRLPCLEALDPHSAQRGSDSKCPKLTVSRHPQIRSSQPKAPPVMKEFCPNAQEMDSVPPGSFGGWLSPYLVLGSPGPPRPRCPSAGGDVTHLEKPRPHADPRTNDGHQPQTLPTCRLVSHPHAEVLATQLPHQVPGCSGNGLGAGRRDPRTPQGCCHPPVFPLPPTGSFKARALERLVTRQLLGPLGRACVGTHVIRLEELTIQLPHAQDKTAGPRQTFRTNQKCHLCTLEKCLIHVSVVISSLKHPLVTLLDRQDEAWTALQGVEGHLRSSPARWPTLCILVSPLPCS